MITENERVEKTVAAMHTNDLSALGNLFAASHQSLADDFESSTREVDALVGIAQATPGVVAARMTGAGFGGCTVNVVESQLAEPAARAVGNGYSRLFNQPASAYVCTASDGASILMTSDE